MPKWETFFKQKNLVNYENQLKSPIFSYEEEIEGINIIHEENKTKYCSLDLLLKKICEDNSFNIEIYINEEKNETFNFINAFIYQCFAFTTYEILINKLIQLHTYYKYNNKLNSIRKNRLFHLIFKLVKYLFDHKIYDNFYFQFNDDLEKKIISFLKANNLNKEIKSFLEYKKSLKSFDNNETINSEKITINGIEENGIKPINKKKIHIVNSYINLPHEGFEFNILKYDEKDIALIITHIRIKKLILLYDHLYEINPKIKSDDKKNRSHLDATSDYVNRIYYFFFEEVLSYDFLDARVEVVEKIILILIELRNLNNFQDLLSIYSALNSISIYLTQTWDQINTKLKSAFKDLEKLCHTSYTNFQKEEIKCWNQNEFFVPIVSIVNKDLIALDEKINYVDKGLVNIEKIIKYQKIIEDFKYKFRNIIRKKDDVIKLPNNKVINELKIIFYNLNPKEYDDLIKIAEKLEPKFTLYKELDKRKRKTKTDLYINSNQFLK